MGPLQLYADLVLTRFSTSAFEASSVKADTRFNFNGCLVKPRLSRTLKQDILSFRGVIWDSISQSGGYELDEYQGEMLMIFNRTPVVHIY